MGLDEFAEPLIPDFHPEARAEFDAEADRRSEYSFQAFNKFNNSVNHAVDDVIFWPEAFPEWEDAENWQEWEGKPIPRSHKVPGFDYRIVYFVKGHTLAIVAVAATKREPGYWRQRGSDYPA